MERLQTRGRRRRLSRQVSLVHTLLIGVALTNKSQINVGEEQGWLGGENEWPYKRFVQSIRSLCGRCINLALTPEVWVSRKFSQALCTSQQNGRLICLRQKKRQEDESETRNPNEFVNRPSPAVRLRRKSACYWISGSVTPPYRIY